MVEKELLIPYRGKIFVETGTQTGGGIDAALENGFEEIHSIEIDKDFYQKAMEFFKDNPKVHLYFGDSRDIFPKIMEKIKEPATIWLDAHMTDDSPIFDELETLKNHPIKNHIILIDDCKNFDPYYNHQGFFEVAKRTQQINLNYKMQLISANETYPQNILVAKEWKK